MAPVFDVAVIGGGIQGAGIAQAAAATGYSTLLVEKTAWGAGTSSKSSKLIHGGLRYLENGQIRLVRESLKERELLLKLAPQLVKRQYFHIPLYRQTRRSNWQLRAGLSLYSLLAGFGRASRFRYISGRRLHGFPLLRQQGLTALYRYSDAQTDDRALTQAVAESARSLGATLLCPAELMAARRVEGGYLVAIRTASSAAANGVNTGIREHRCRCLVNATGPWVNSLVQRVQPAPSVLDVDLVQGAHLLYNQALDGNCYYLEAPRDGRAVFVLPWRGGAMIGTTETLFEGPPEQCRPRPGEVAYLQQVGRHYFPRWPHWQHPSDQFAGLRVLPRSDSSLFTRNREMQLLRDGNYLAVYGGKLTGYRLVAEKVVRRIGRIIGNRAAIADTAELPLAPVAGELRY